MIGFEIQLEAQLVEQQSPLRNFVNKFRVFCKVLLALEFFLAVQKNYKLECIAT